MRKYLHVAVALFLCCLAFTPRAHAYIDPGTGSMLLQALAAGFVAVLVFWKRIYAGIAAFFSKNKTGDTENMKDNDGKDDA